MAGDVLPVLTLGLVNPKKDAEDARKQQAAEFAALQNKQNELQSDAKRKEDAAVSQAFAQTASRKRSGTAAALPGAVSRTESIGGTGQGSATTAAKRLIGE